MKVKELIEILQKCDPELDAAYEHCYVDYAEERKEEGIVEMGDLRPTFYSSWIPISKVEPSESQRPFLVALYFDNEWHYYTDDKLFCGISTAGKMGGKWMPIERTQEHILKIAGLTDEEIEKTLKKDDNKE